MIREGGYVIIHSLMQFNDWLNGVVWGPPFMALLAGADACGVDG